MYHKKHSAIHTTNTTKWAGLCEKGPYGCGHGWDIAWQSSINKNDHALWWNFDRMLRNDDALQQPVVCIFRKPLCWSFLQFLIHQNRLVFGKVTSVSSVSSSQILSRSWLYENSHNSTKEQDFYKRFSSVLGEMQDLRRRVCGGDTARSRCQAQRTQCRH